MATNDFPEKNALTEAVRLADGLGRRVSVVLHQRRNVLPQIFADTMALATPTRVDRVLRTNGRERIEFASGGRIRFFAPPRTIRGESSDVLVLSDELTEEQRDECMLAIIASKNQMVIQLGDIANR